MRRLERISVTSPWGALGELGKSAVAAALCRRSPHCGSPLRIGTGRSRVFKSEDKVVKVAAKNIFLLFFTRDVF
jgi:hypothetical protein